MGRREDAAKVRKLKRRGRYARFSGSTTKTVARYDVVLEHITEERTHLKTIEIYVGPKSMGRQVINTGRGPDPQRMQSYYDHVPTGKTKAVTLAEDLGIKDKRYSTIWWNTPSTNKLNIVDAPRIGRLDLFYSENGCFFVDLDYKLRIIKRSTVYRTIEIAKNRLQLHRILWVEQIPME